MLYSDSYDARKAAKYIISHDIRLEFGDLGNGTSAGYVFNTETFEFEDRILVDEDSYKNDYLYTLSVVVHEVIHIQQGMPNAITVMGELEAWQIGFRVYRDLTGQLPSNSIVAQEILSLTVSWDGALWKHTETTRRARSLRKSYIPGYRSECLLPIDRFFYDRYHDPDEGPFWWVCLN